MNNKQGLKSPKQQQFSSANDLQNAISDPQKQQLFSQFLEAFNKFCDQNKAQSNQQINYDSYQAQSAAFARKSSLKQGNGQRSLFSSQTRQDNRGSLVGVNSVTFRDQPDAQISSPTDMAYQFQQTNTALMKAANLSIKMNSQALKSSKKESKEEDDKEADENQQNLQFLRYGDIICLNYFQSFQIQQEIKTPFSMEKYELNERAVDEDEVKVEMVHTNKFGHLHQMSPIASPGRDKDQEEDHFYKGILWSDGVSNKNLSIIPKTSMSKQGECCAHECEHESSIVMPDDYNGLNGSKQVGKCLFRIETIKEYEQALLYAELEQRLQQQEDAIDNETIDKKRVELVRTKDRLVEELKRLEEALSEEIRNNEYDLQMNLGKKVTYGERIILKHLFSDLYLSLNKKAVAKQDGCVSLQLADPTQNSQFTMIPSLKTKELGQPVCYLDFFYMQHFDVDHQLDKYQFYIHVASSEEEIQEGGRIFEVNGSNEPSSFKAKLFVDFDKMQKDVDYIFSGNTIQLFHQDIEGHLTVSQRKIKKFLKNYPDFLQEEKKQLLDPQQTYDASNLGKDQKIQNFSQQSAQRSIKGLSKNDFDSDRKIQDVKYKQKIFLQRNESELVESDSHWEIHKFKPFQGGPVEWDDKCRIKHISSGKFLAASKGSETQKARLYLKDSPDQLDTVFILRRENYLTTFKDKRDPVKDEDYVLIESIHKNFLKSGIANELFDEERYLGHQDKDTQADGTSKLERSFSSHLNTPQTKMYRDSIKLTSNPLKPPAQDTTATFQQHNESFQKEMKDDALETEQAEEVNDEFTVSVQPEEFMKHEISRMVFKIKRVDNQEALLSQQGASFFEFFARCYNYLMTWAIGSPEKRKIEDLTHARELHFNDVSEAILKEDELSNKAEEMFEALRYLQSILLKAQDDSAESQNMTQTYFAQQGILKMIIKLIELIYFRTIPPKERSKPFEKISKILDHKSILKKTATKFIHEISKDSQEFQKPKDEEVFLIANDHLKEVQDMLLRTVYLLIKHNVVNSSIVTAYDDVFFIQLKHHDIHVLTSIFKETYKRAQQILGEDAAQVASSSQGGLEISDHHPFSSSKGAMQPPQLSQLGSKMQSQLYHNSANYLTLPKYKSQMGSSTIQLFSQDLSFEKVGSSQKQRQHHQIRDDLKVSRWANLLGMISLKDPKDDTISQQLLYLQVLSMMCTDHQGQGVYKYQMQIISSIFKPVDIQAQIKETNSLNQIPRNSTTYIKAPLKLKIIDGKIYALLHLDIENHLKAKGTMGETVLQKHFKEENPLLTEDVLYDYEKRDKDDPDQFYYHLDLIKLSKNYARFFPYVDYIVSVIKLYTNLCVSRNIKGIQLVQEMGFTYTNLVKHVCRKKWMGQIVKASIIELIRVMFVDSDSFLQNYSSLPRLYPWIFMQENSQIQDYQENLDQGIKQKGKFIDQENLFKPNQGDQNMEQQKNHENEIATLYQKLLTHRDIYMRETTFFAQKEEENFDFIRQNQQRISSPYYSCLFSKKYGSRIDSPQTYLTETQAKELRSIITKLFNVDFVEEQNQQKKKNESVENTVQNDKKDYEDDDFEDFQGDGNENIDTNEIKETKENMDMKIKVYQSYIDLATSLIRTEHVDFYFVKKMIKVAVMIFIKYDIEKFNLSNEATALKSKKYDDEYINGKKIKRKYRNIIEDYNRKQEIIRNEKSKIDEEKRTENYNRYKQMYPIVSFLNKVDSSKFYRYRIDTLEIKTLRMLEYLCYFRLDSQVLMIINFFRKLLEKGMNQKDIEEQISDLKYENQDAQSKSRSFAKQFETIFKIFQFSNDNDLQMTKEMTEKITYTINMLLEENYKKLTDLTHEPQNRFLRLYHESINKIVNSQSEAETQMSTLEKISSDLWKKFSCCQAKSVKKDDSLDTCKFGLYKLLLYCVFKKTHNAKIRDEAAKVLVINFKQQSLLIEELQKANILISYQDQEDYEMARLKTLHLIHHITKIVHLYNFDRFQNENQETDQIEISLMNVSELLKQLIIQIQDSTDRQSRTQSFLRHLNLHFILIVQLLSQIDLSTCQQGFLKRKFIDCYKIVSNFLLAFSFNNSKNQKALLCHLSFLLNLMDLDEVYAKQNQNLIASILWRGKNTEEGQRFMHFILKKIDIQNSFNTRTLKLLNLLTFESPDNQNIILKHLVQKKEFVQALKLKDDNQNSLKKLLNIILSNEQSPFSNLGLSQLKYEAYKTKTEVKEVWDRLQLHLICIELLSNCSQSHYGILSIRKQLSPHHILHILGSSEYPLLVKKYYFRLLYQVYINGFGEDLSTMDLNTPQLIEMLQNSIQQFKKRTQCIEDFNKSCNNMLTENLNVTSINDEESLVKPSLLEDKREKTIFEIDAKRVKQPNIFDTYKNQKEFNQTQKSQYDGEALMNQVFQLYELFRFLTLFKHRQNKQDGFLHFTEDFFRTIILTKQNFNQELLQLLQSYSTYIKELHSQVSLLKVNLKTNPERLSNFSKDSFKLFKEQVSQVHTVLKMADQIPYYFYQDKVLVFKLSKAADRALHRENRENSEATEIEEVFQLQDPSNSSYMAQMHQKVYQVIDRVRQYLVSKNYKISHFESDLLSKRYDEKITQDFISQVTKTQLQLGQAPNSSVEGVAKYDQTDKDSARTSRQLERKNSQWSLLCCKQDEEDEEVQQDPKNSQTNKNKQAIVSEKKLMKFLRQVCPEISFDEANAVVSEIHYQAQKIQSQKAFENEQKIKVKGGISQGLFAIMNKKSSAAGSIEPAQFINYMKKSMSQQQLDDDLNRPKNDRGQSKLKLGLSSQKKPSPEKQYQDKISSKKSNEKTNSFREKEKQSFITMNDLNIIFASKQDITLLPQDLRFKFYQPSKECLDFFKMDYNLASKCNEDFKEFIQLFNLFCRSSHIKDELTDLITSIYGLFNHSFESNNTQVIKDFISNMVKSFENSDYKLYLMRILDQILEQYKETTVSKDKTMTLANKVIMNKRLHKIQLVMSECNILNLLLGIIKRDERPEINNEAIKLLCSLLCESNIEIQKEFLILLKTNRREFNLLEFIKDRLVISTEGLIKDTLDALVIKGNIAFELEKTKLDKQIQTLEAQLQESQLDAKQKKDKKNKERSKSKGKTKGNIQVQKEKRSKEVKDRIRDQEDEKSKQYDQLINMLKLIQYFVDGCYRPFQNFLIDQDQIEDDETQQVSSVDQLAALKQENKQKSTINILIEVANVLIRLTTKLEVIIFSDYRLQLTISQILDTLIDFLYGPCQQAQQLLSGWKKFMKCLNIYLIQDLGYYSVTTTLLHSKISIFTKCTKLLLALTETETKEFMKTQMEEITNQIDIGNLKRKMVDIFTYKVGVSPKRERIYYSNKRCNHYYNPKKTGAYNLCMKDEFCQYGHYIKFDKKIIESGFNIFIFLQNLYELQPTLHELLDCDFSIRNQIIYRQNTQRYLPILECQSNRNVIHQRVMARLNTEEYEKAEAQKAEALVKESDPRMAEFRFREIDNRRKRLEKAEKAKQEKYFPLKKSKPEKEVKVYHPDTHSDYIEMIKAEEQRSKDKNYTYEQFRIDKAIRFYIQNVARLEIMYNGKLVSVMFKIPPYCHYMGENARKQLIYGSSDNDSQSDKLESFFKRINITKTEMKSLQFLERESTLKSFFSNNWGNMQACSLVLIIVINILFLVYYQTDEVTSTIYITNPWAEVAVQILTIIQALLSFIIMASYFQKYHAVMYIQENEKATIVRKKWFTNFRGTLGYAFGQNTIKLSHGTEHELKATLMENSKIKPQKRKRKREILYYWAKCCYFGIKNDIRFLFNLLYFIASVLGIFYHFLFSFLLLDIIIKVPLLETVVQAIVQNKKQIFYTLMLLFMIIYIYSFIAFILFRGSYINVNFNPEDADVGLNNYCNSLVMCFTSTLNNGLRSGGGIGDVLAQLDQNQDLYWGRWAFDLTFFIFIIIIMLNLIFGIIIDAFADMRDSRNKTEQEVREKCFICGISRFNFEAQNKNFQDHVQREHNAYAYLYFVLYLLKKPFNECSGVEKYVKQLAIAEDPKFFPINKSLSLNMVEAEEEKLQKEA